MAKGPMFVYAAAYDTTDDALADYEVFLEAHAEGWVGTYDAAVLEKTPDGKVHVHKDEMPTRHGAWAGAGVGALIGLVFPPALIGSAVVGATAGGVIGHLKGGMSRGDLKELGDYLGENEAALIVIAEDHVQEELDKRLTRAAKTMEKEVDADPEALESNWPRPAPPEPVARPAM
jgi:uncharacterized membrane protein